MCPTGSEASLTINLPHATYFFQSIIKGQQIVNHFVYYSVFKVVVVRGLTFLPQAPGMSLALCIFEPPLQQPNLLSFMWEGVYLNLLQPGTN